MKEHDQDSRVDDTQYDQPLATAAANEPQWPTSRSKWKTEAMVDRTCTCLGTCKGADGLGEGWTCALAQSPTEGNAEEARLQSEEERRIRQRAGGGGSSDDLGAEHPTARADQKDRSIAPLLSTGGHETVAVLLNRLVLAAVAKGYQQDCDNFPEDDRITDADIEKLEAQILSALTEARQEIADLKDRLDKATVNWSRTLESYFARTDQAEADLSRLRERVKTLEDEMRVHAGDLIVMSDTDNHNAQVAGRNILRWADRLASLAPRVEEHEEQGE